jgi:hypothetical protein
MRTTRYELIDPVFSGEQADAVVRLCERYGRYGTYAQQQIEEDFGNNLFQRHDVGMNFLKTGGRFGRREELKSLAARTNYFRETYAYAEPIVDGIEPFLRNEAFVEAARKLYDRPVIEPAIVFANLHTPGMEHGVHTDVPEFRGCNRTKDPEFLMVVMHHSGLFDRWRMPIATLVSWWSHCRGGDFVFYPRGIDGPPATVAAKFNTAIITDTDTVFHGVDRVDSSSDEMAPIMPGMHLDYTGDAHWEVRSAAGTLARYSWNEIRFSVSWKAYCFEDEAERRMVHEHNDDLTRAQIMDILISDLRERGRLGDQVPGGRDLALLMIEEYVRFPPTMAAAA